MDQPTFKQIQYDFAAHIRDPDNHPVLSGIEERRMTVYRDLFYNNIEGFISSAFPVLRTLYDDEDWYGLVRDYFARHRANTPHFPEMGGEFVAYLDKEFTLRECDPAFILELAHYEWMETVAVLSQVKFSDVDFDPEGDVFDQAVVISPLAWLLYYEWPVHMISCEQRPEEKPEHPTWIIIYRDRDDDVGFVTVSTVTARLMQLLDSGKLMTGRQALQQVVTEINHPEPAVILEMGLDMLKQLREKDIILGTVFSGL